VVITPDRAGEVAASSEAELVLATVYNPLSGREQAGLSGMDAPGTAPRGKVRGMGRAQQILDLTLQEINTSRVRVADKLILEGDPAQALVDAADLHRADLIVIGNRGLGALTGSLLGSITSEISQRASCDVLIVQSLADDTPIDDAGPGDAGRRSGAG
jgi:nucleotide-binding universal stress UspA family protein